MRAGWLGASLHRCTRHKMADTNRAYGLSLAGQVYLRMGVRLGVSKQTMITITDTAHLSMAPQVGLCCLSLSKGPEVGSIPRLLG